MPCRCAKSHCSVDDVTVKLGEVIVRGVVIVVEPLGCIGGRHGGPRAVIAEVVEEVVPTFESFENTHRVSLELHYLAHMKDRTIVDAFGLVVRVAERLGLGTELEGFAGEVAANRLGDSSSATPGVVALVAG